jgi:hypothetical protein
MLRLNNNTRWDSSSEMIDCVLKLRNAVDAFMVVAMNKHSGKAQKGDREKIVADKLYPGDLRELEDLHALLKPLRWSCKAI